MAKGVILPTNKVKQWWDLLIIVLLLYTAIYIPIKVSFIEESYTAVFVFELLVDILFLTDVVLTFFTAFYKKNELIIDKTEIMKNYMSGWFLIDLTTSIPTQLIESAFANSESFSGNGKILRLLRIPRIFKLLRLTKIMKLDVFNLIGEFQSWIKQLMSIGVAILFLTHLLACFWFSTSKLQDFPQNSWVVEMEGENNSNGFNYLISFYWAF